MSDFIVTLFLGWLGVHKFMQKKYVLGISYLFTFGLFGIGWCIDIIVSFVKLLKGDQTLENQLPKSIQNISGQNKEFTKPQLEGMKKADILEMAAGLGYTMTTIESDTKDRIIADFIAQQEKQPSLITKKWLIKTLSTEIAGTFAECALSKGDTREEIICSLKPNSSLHLEYWEYEGEPAYYVCDDKGDDAGCIPATLAKRLYDVYSDCDIVVELNGDAWYDARNDIRQSIKLKIYK